MCVCACVCACVPKKRRLPSRRQNPPENYSHFTRCRADTVGSEWLRALAGRHPPACGISRFTMDDTCCDESPLCNSKRTAASTSCGCACSCCLLLCAMLVPFATGLWICLPCGWPVQPSPPPPAPTVAPVPREGVGIIFKASDTFSGAALVVSVLAMNSALGIAIGYCMFCALGDVGGACAIRGSEKRLCWWLLLSCCGGLVGLVLCSCCVWPSPWAMHEVHVGASRAPPRSHGQHQKHRAARPNGAGFGSNGHVSSGYL